jgi:hypothetical protein
MYRYVHPIDTHRGWHRESEGELASQVLHFVSGCIPVVSLQIRSVYELYRCGFNGMILLTIISLGVWRSALDCFGIRCAIPTPNKNNTHYEPSLTLRAPPPQQLSIQPTNKQSKHSHTHTIPGVLFS